MRGVPGLPGNVLSIEVLGGIRAACDEASGLDAFYSSAAMSTDTRSPGISSRNMIRGLFFVAYTE